MGKDNYSVASISHTTGIGRGTVWAFLGSLVISEDGFQLGMG